MLMKKKINEKKCRICARTLEGKSKTGLCPSCVNKYGTPAAATGVAGLMVGAKVVVKNRNKIAKGAVKIGKTVWSLVRK